MEKSLTVPNETSTTYGNYLKVHDLLDLQEPLTKPEEHDELLFIIIHQSYELWFKQVIHELTACCRFLEKGELMRVMAGLKRVDAIQKVIIHKVDILETMTPDDFARFRGKLNPASGFQSYQFRVFEFLMGLKGQDYAQFHKHDPKSLRALEDAFNKPSLYDFFLRFLHQRGYQIPESILMREVSKPHQEEEKLTDIFEDIYRNPYQNSDIYLALEALLDVDEQFLLWRYRHKSMVERMIGTMMGTGGSSGSKYLATTMTKRCFPEIWAVRNRLTPTYGGEA